MSKRTRSEILDVFKELEDKLLCKIFTFTVKKPKDGSTSTRRNYVKVRHPDTWREVTTKKDQQRALKKKKQRKKQPCIKI